MMAKAKRVAWDSVPEFCGVQAAAVLLGISEVTVRRLLTQKKLRRFKIGGRTVVRLDEVRALPTEEAK
jgi:excisionase family DNA binding protein